jgi:porin
MLYGEVKQKTEFFGMAGKQVIGGFYGTGRFSDLDPASFVSLPAGVVTPKETGTWTILWNMEQRLWTDAGDSDRGIGLYIQNGIGDGNPNPVRWFSSVDICGNSVLPGRGGDTFGGGFYYLGPSGVAKGAFPGLRNEQGVELFYNARVGRGCHLTPDLQIVNPGLGSFDAAIVYGVRFKVDF